MTLPEDYLRNYINDPYYTPGSGTMTDYLETHTLPYPTTTVLVNHTPLLSFPFEVFLNGLLQKPAEDYSLVNSNIIFIASLKSGDIVQAAYRSFS